MGNNSSNCNHCNRCSSLNPIKQQRLSNKEFIWLINRISPHENKILIDRRNKYWKEYTFTKSLPFCLSVVGFMFSIRSLFPNSWIGQRKSFPIYSTIGFLSFISSQFYVFLCSVGENKQLVYNLFIKYKGHIFLRKAYEVDAKKEMIIQIPPHMFGVKPKKQIYTIIWEKEKAVKT